MKRGDSVQFVTEVGYSYCVRHCPYYIMNSSSYQNKSIREEQIDSL